METTENTASHSAIVALQCGPIPTDKLAEVERLTREIFSADVRIERVDDPEIEAESYFSVRVRTGLDLKSIADKRREWYERTWKELAGACHHIRLAIGES